MTEELKDDCDQTNWDVQINNTADETETIISKPKIRLIIRLFVHTVGQSPWVPHCCATTWTATNQCASEKQMCIEQSLPWEPALLASNVPD